MSELMAGLAAVLITTSLVLIIAQRLDLPRYSAYITAGVLSGSAVGLIKNLGVHASLELETILGLAEAGAAFLVFVTALRLFPQRTKNHRPDALRISLTQVGLQMLLGVSIGYALGLDVVNSVLIGLASGVSSTLVSTEKLEREISESSRFGRLTESITLFDDTIAAILTAAILSGAATGNFWLASFSTAAILAAYAARPLGSRLVKTLGDGSEVILMTGIGSVMLSGFLFSLLGGNAVIGAFAAGIFFSKNPMNLKMLESMEPIKDFFSAVFFISLGLLLDLPNGIGFVLMFTLIFSVSILRPVLISALARFQGYSSYDSVKTSLYLDQMSEFVLLAALIGFQAGWLSEPVFQAVVSAGAITMITAELTTRNSDLLYAKVPDRFKPEKSMSFLDLKNHLVLIGYNEIGKIIAGSFENILVVDEDPEKIREAKEDGFETLEGSTDDVSTWGRADVRDAKAVVSVTGKDRDARNAAYQGIPCAAITKTEEVARDLRTLPHVEIAARIDEFAMDNLEEKIENLIEETQNPLTR